MATVTAAKPQVVIDVLFEIQNGIGLFHVMTARGGYL